MSTLVVRFFAAAEAKLRSAESQIAELDTQSQKFFAPLIDDLAARIEAASPGDEISINVPEEVAAELSVLCGQIAGSLRSPLDYLATELSRMHSGTTEKAAFPFGHDARALEQGIKNGAKLMSDEAKDFIRAQRLRLDRAKPRSEPVVGQARWVAVSVSENTFLKCAGCRGFRQWKAHSIR